MADATTLGTDIAQGEPRWRVIWRNAFPFLVVGAIWEAVARAGVFPARLFPSLETIAAAFWRLTLNGILPHHALDTVIRLGAGFALAAVAGVAIGIPMGRSRRAEDIFLPLVEHRRADPRPRLCAAVPALVRARQQSTVLLVGFVSAFPIIFNTWTGVKAVKDIWVRSAQAMGADDRAPVPPRHPARRAALHPHRPAARPRAGLAHPGRASRCSPPCRGGSAG